MSKKLTREFTTPPGRWVQGHPLVEQTTNMQGEPLVWKTGKNAGQPRSKYFIAVAFPKGSPEWAAVEAEIKTFAAQCWPQFFPQGPHGACAHPSFSFKLMDGDGIDGLGQRNADKTGFAGHMVLRAESSYAPSIFPRGKYDLGSRITDANMITCGSYVRISVSMESNENIQKPGIYVNLRFVEIVAYGEEIVTGPRAADAFANQEYALPAGARPTPGAAPSTAAAQGAGPASYGTPPAYSQPTPQPIASPTNAAPQYTQYMQPPVPPPAAPPPPPPTTPPGPQMTPAATAQGYTYDLLKASGWSDDQMRQQGYLM